MSEKKDVWQGTAGADGAEDAAYAGTCTGMELRGASSKPAAISWRSTTERCIRRF